jgi:hypothetical protein
MNDQRMNDLIDAFIYALQDPAISCIDTEWLIKNDVIYSEAKELANYLLKRINGNG